MSVYLTLLFPLLGSILNGFFLGKKNNNTHSDATHKSDHKDGHHKDAKHNSDHHQTFNLNHIVAVCAMAASFICAIVTVIGFFATKTPLVLHLYSWITVGDLNIPMELRVDELSAFMLPVITGIGTLIHIYAQGYLHDEKSTSRFFAYLNLFVFMMLVLILSNNLLVMFIGWEGVGLCSYLLIGYWFSDTKNAYAGIKAFVVNRIGDAGFLLGIFLLFKHFKTLSFSELPQLIASQPLSPEILFALSVIALCLFVGVCGKSAQIPLYIWLPDAMAGPTPVSALIHAATMVTAGIFLMTRMHYVFYLAPDVMALIAIIGCLTAFFAATIALVQTDIKKVLAYSTVSQLGYMVMACGVGAFDAAFFHLLTHACFKALLFLCAGSIIVALHHKQDIAFMGGLKSKLPITYKLFGIGVLAIIGTPMFSGFFSKDLILAKVYSQPEMGLFLWIMGCITAAMTAFYMVRIFCLIFLGERRSEIEPHEVSWDMWVPLSILALLSIGIGYLEVPEVFGPFLGNESLSHYFSAIVKVPEAAHGHWAYLHEHFSHEQEILLMAISTSGALGSATLAYFLYNKGPSTFANSVSNALKPIYTALQNKYWVDEFFYKIIVTPLYEMSQFLYKIVDLFVIQGGINTCARLVQATSGVMSFKTSGFIQSYSFVFLLGMFSLLLWFSI